MNNILVPTDFSKNAETALYYAIELAKKEQAKIILLHAYDIPFTVADVPVDLINQELSSARQESHNRMKALAAKIEHAGSIKYELVNVHEFPITAILNAIEKKKIDIVVMGTKGASGMSAAVFGSIAEKTIEKAPCPVLAIPDEATYKGIRKITYATDYKYNDLANLRKTIEFAKEYNAQLNVLHVSDGTLPVAEERANMKAFMEKVNSRTPYNNMSFQVLSGRNVKKVLQEYMDADSTSMLVMSAHRRNFFDKLFGKSLTKKIALQTKIPLMALHNQSNMPIRVF